MGVIWGCFEEGIFSMCGYIARFVGFICRVGSLDINILYNVEVSKQQNNTILLMVVTLSLKLETVLFKLPGNKQYK